MVYAQGHFNIFPQANHPHSYLKPFHCPIDCLDDFDFVDLVAAEFDVGHDDDAEIFDLEHRRRHRLEMNWSLKSLVEVVHAELECDLD